MFAAAKLICLVIYALGIAAAIGLLPESWHIVVTIAVLLFSAHFIEVIVMFKHVKRYQGPLVVSVLLTLLFGLGHWLPLARQQSNDTP